MTGWPSEVERLVYAQLDTAVVLYLAYCAEIDASVTPRR